MKFAAKSRMGKVAPGVMIIDAGAYVPNERPCVFSGATGSLHSLAAPSEGSVKRPSLSAQPNNAKDGVAPW